VLRQFLIRVLWPAPRASLQTFSQLQSSRIILLEKEHFSKG
jgi:hypothetical protein